MRQWIVNFSFGNKISIQSSWPKKRISWLIVRWLIQAWPGWVILLCAQNRPRPSSRSKWYFIHHPLYRPIKPTLFTHVICRAKPTSRDRKVVKKITTKLDLKLHSYDDVTFWKKLFLRLLRFRIPRTKAKDFRIMFFFNFDKIQVEKSKLSQNVIKNFLGSF